MGDSTTPGRTALKSEFVTVKPPRSGGNSMERKNMKVFVSWSGEKSRAVATAVSEWLGFVHQSVDTWVSTKDIHVGDRWATEIENGLQDAAYGIICVTPENVDSKWINYEAGAISKKIGTSSGKVAVLLIDFDSEADLEMPLSQFHAVMMTKAGFDDLAVSVNNAIEGSARADRDVVRAAELAWPRLESDLAAIKVTEPDTKKRKRSDQDLLEEIVLRLRDMDSRMDHLANRGFHLASGDAFDAETSSSRAREKRMTPSRTHFSRFIRTILSDTEVEDWGVVEREDGGIELVVDRPLGKQEEFMVRSTAKDFLGAGVVTVTVDPARAARSASLRESPRLRETTRLLSGQKLN